MKEILIRPRIQNVPGAAESIRGISIYEERLLVYYCLGDGKDNPCGIILRMPDDALVGITGEVDGEEWLDPDELVPVMPGIWERCRDKTD